MMGMTYVEIAKQAIGVVAFCLNVWGNLELTRQGKAIGGIEFQDLPTGN